MTTDILLLDANPYYPPIPPVGLEVLAGELERNGFSSRIHSASPILPDYAEKLDALALLEARAVGLQIRNYDWALMRRDHPRPVAFYRSVARRLRRQFGHAPMILGGAGFSVDPGFWLRELGAEFGIVGSGEAPLAALLRWLLHADGDPTAIPGLVRAGAEGALPPEAPGELSGVDRSRLDFTPWESYARESGQPLAWANIEISRGCRYRCDFCVEPRVFGRRVAYKPVEKVVAELEQLIGRGVDRVFFCNSEFNQDPAYCLRLCRALAASGAAAKVRWQTYLIPNRFPAELAQAMAAAGCESVSFNAVHVNDRILASLRCPHRRRHFEASLERAAAAGLQVSTTFLLGSALEDSETLGELERFIDERALPSTLSIGLAHYPVLPPSPGLEIGPASSVDRGVGNGSIPYSSTLTATDLDGLVAWAAEREYVTVQNRPPGDAARPSWAPYLELIEAASENGNGDGDAALARLRELVPLLDLPEVRLGHSAAFPAPPEPAFLLYGPFRRLSDFYEALGRFLEDPETRVPRLSRLLLRLGRCRGEFPRILDFVGSRLEGEAVEWLARTWRERNSLPQLVFAGSYACQASCPYCYAKDVDRVYPGRLRRRDFQLALEWAVRQECRVISFVGGEPTLHPHFSELLSRVRDAGLMTYFNSNLLCDPRVIEPLDGGWVLNLGIHAQAAGYSAPRLEGHLERNVAALRERGVYLFLRYNFEQATDSAIEQALALARRFEVPQVNFALPMPALSRRNQHVVEQQLLDSGEFLVRAVESFRQAGLLAILTKPIPPCALPEDRLSFLRAGEALAPACNLPQRQWTQNVLVGPDLRISTCVGVTGSGPSLLSFDSFDEVSEYLVGHLRRILRPTPFDRCHTCNFHSQGRCLGGCLAYFTDGERPATAALGEPIRLGGPYSRPGAGRPPPLGARPET